MIISDLIFPFNLGVNHQRFGICRVRVFVARNQTYTVLTDLGELNIGPSVTNAVEHITSSLIGRGHIPTNTRVFEHYERSHSGLASYEEIINPFGQKISWERISEAELATLLEVDVLELTSATNADLRLVRDIERLRHSLDPHRDFPFPESSKVIQRSLEIERQMLPRGVLESAIQADLGERELQQLIGKDLSLLGEIYAGLPDEYICFSEFPIGDGYVDFVVFTGRSRLDIFLIEVKGADFNLMNSDAYSGFNAKINQAADQIRKRYRVIYEALAKNRKQLHSLRERAEAGKCEAFLGARTPLQVDPNKDINVYGVVIGGRMKNDLKESLKRHEYESHFTPHIKVESWDSWARKLQRG